MLSLKIVFFDRELIKKVTALAENIKNRIPFSIQTT